MQRRPILRFAAMATFAATVCASALTSQAQDTTPIKILVGASPGGFTDTVARALAAEMSLVMKGRSVVVENRPGAGGNIAAQMVSKATPDGTTLLVSFTSHAINATLYPKLPFDPIKDFTPLTQLATAPGVLVVSPTVQANTLNEFIALAKREPGKLNFGIPGVGASTHLAGEMFKMQAGLNIVSIPYKGTSPVITALLAGEVQMSMATVSNAKPYVVAGKLRALGVTSAKRVPEFPDVQAISEVLPGFESNAWYALFGPANMAPDLVKTISDAARKAVATPAVRARLEQDGATVVAGSPDELAALLKADIPRWGKIVKASGASAE